MNKPGIACVLQAASQSGDRARRTDALKAVAQRNVEVGGQAAHDGLAVGAYSAT